MTGVRRWDQFQAHLDEHFTDCRAGYSTLRDAWDWLSHDAHYVLVFKEQLLLDGAGKPVEFWLRRLVALSRCYRKQGSHHTTVLQDAGIFRLELAPSMPTTCRMVAVPLHAPFAHTLMSPPTPGKAPAGEQVEFSLAAHPFVNAIDFAELDSNGLTRAWTWLCGHSSDRADRIRHALECFETANSLGGGSGSIAPAFQEAWALIALMTTLETLFNEDDDRTDRSGAVVAGVEQTLRRQPSLDSGEIAARVDGVRNAIAARNKCVHRGIAELELGQLESLRDTVALMLKDRIESALNNDVKQP